MLDTHRHVACVHINEGSASTISWNHLHYLHCSNLGRGTERGAKMQLAAVGGHFIGNWVVTTLWIMSQLCPNYVQLAGKSHPKIPQTSREHWKFGRNHGRNGEPLGIKSWKIARSELERLPKIQELLAPYFKIVPRSTNILLPCWGHLAKISIGSCRNMIWNMIWKCNDMYGSWTGLWHFVTVWWISTFVYSFRLNLVSVSVTCAVSVTFAACTLSFNWMQSCWTVSWWRRIGRPHDMRLGLTSVPGSKLRHVI